MADKPTTSDKPTTFAREATGLVRSVGPLNGLVYAIANTGYLYGLFLFVTLFPQLGTGQDLLEAAAISIIPVTAFTGIYYYFSLVAPRTGGDYVWLSRWLHPMLGFISSVMGLAFTEFIFIGLTGLTIQTTGFSVMFATIGSILNNQGMVNMAPAFSSQFGILVGGTIVIWGLGAVVMLGMKWYLRAQTFFYAIIFLIMAILIGIFLTTTPTSFASSFNTYSAPYANTSNYYQGIINTASSNGWVAPTSSWSNVLLLIPFLGLPVVAFNTLSYIGGEFKNSRRSWIVGLFGGSYSLLIWITVAVTLAYHAFGFQFLSALGFLFYADPSALVLPAIPYVNYLAAIAVSGIPIVVVILSLAVLQQLFYQPAATLTTSRAIFAYSFDRLVPERLSKVSSRFRSPIYAVLVVLSFSEVMLIFFSVPFTATYAFLAGNVASLVAFIAPGALLGITAIIFPYRFKSLYDSSPIKKSFAGIPRITWAGLITTVFFLVGVFLFLTNSTYGANSTPDLEAALSSLVGVIVIYLVARAYRNKQGIPLQAIYSEIPPE